MTDNEAPAEATAEEDPEPWLKADWDGPVDEVAKRVKLLKALMTSSSIENDFKEMMWAKVVVPAMMLLVQFCDSVQVIGIPPSIEGQDNDSESSVERG